MELDIGRKLCFIDLFAGAGGLAEGFYQAGFTPIAQVEMNESAAKTLETRAAFRYLSQNVEGGYKIYNQYITGTISRDELLKRIPLVVTRGIINAELSPATISGVFTRIDDIMQDSGVTHVDIIIGGPPCQAYSLVGRAQSNHMSRPMSEDPRNELYKMYTRFLKKYQPSMFVFENVSGITSARGGSTFKNLKAELKRVGYTIECREQNARDFGVLQNRKRMIIIGWKKNLALRYPLFKKNTPNAIVNDLLRDLPNPETNCKYTVKYCKASDYLRNYEIRTPQDVLTLHDTRKNNVRDKEIYLLAINEWNNGHRRLKYSELPERLKTHRNQSSFLDRFKVVEGDMNYSHTVLAHLAKDGHYFIHPDASQCRSITVREAARLQSFPDSYFFEGNRSARFVQIGNAVPPLMAFGIASAIRHELIELLNQK